MRPGTPVSLIDELKRRNVFRVGAAYLALGWIVTQVTATVVPVLNLPPLLVQVVVWVGVIAFPFVLLFSWVYELTPEGLKRESEVDRSASITDHTAHRLDRMVIALLVVAIVLFVADRLLPGTIPGLAPEPAADATRGGDSSAGAGPARDTDTAAAARPDRGHGAPPQEATTAAGPAADDKSIAVLPFVNMSSDKEQEYFSDGLSEELLNLLAQVPELRVIARTSSFAFKGKEVDVATIAQQLNVANLLEGSVRKSGNTLRITAQLIRTADSSHLWSQTFDREMTDVFAVQDEIAGAVVDALKLKLLPQAHAGKAQTANTEAYNRYLLGRQYYARGNTDGWRKAIEAFKQAIALDPQYAAAYAGLAGAELFAADFERSAEAIAAGKDRARAAAERAVELGPDIAEARAARALLRATIDWDWAGAAADLQRALELDPGNAAVQRSFSNHMSTLGRNTEALVAARRSNELDPLSAPSWNTLAGALWATGDLPGARAAMERALAINPDSDFAQINLGALDLVENKHEAARERFERMQNTVWSNFGGALSQHSLGNADKSQQMLDWLVREHADGWAYQIAEIHAWRGNTEAAFEWLERARVQRDGGLANIKTDFLLDSLHDDPRYPEFLKKLGLPPD